jgi:hypothetical protein
MHAPPSPRALCAPSAGVGNGPWAGSAPLGSRQAKPSGSVATPCRPSACCTLMDRAQFQPDGRLEIQNSFLFYFDSNSNLNFKNSYLDIQSSKNYETSSIGFIIL